MVCDGGDGEPTEGARVVKVFGGKSCGGVVLYVPGVEHAVLYEDGDEEALDEDELRPLLLKRRRIEPEQTHLAFNPMDPKVPEYILERAAAHYKLAVDGKQPYELRHQLVARHAMGGAAATPPDGGARDAEPWVKAVCFMLCSAEHPTTFTFERKYHAASDLPLEAKVTVKYGIGGRKRAVPGQPMGPLV